MSTTYAQTTIHSKVAKFQKGQESSFGNICKGTMLKLKGHHSLNQHADESSLQIKQEIQLLPKTKSNMIRKMRNQVISSVSHADGKDQVVLMESGVFPAIYYKKSINIHLLCSNHAQRTQGMYHINLQKSPFHKMCVHYLPMTHESHSSSKSSPTFSIKLHSISSTYLLVRMFQLKASISSSQVHLVNNADSETIPFTKCCNAPVYIELMQNGSGKVLCNSAKCPHSNLAEFLINFQDGRKLWRNIAYFVNASHKDKQLRHKISKLISNGEYKRVSLVNVVQNTSRQIIDLFYDSKPQTLEVVQDEDQSPFLTANQPKQHSVQSQSPQDVTVEDILSPQDNQDIDILKIKLKYMTRNQKELSKKVSKKLVNQSKVFHKNFDMIKKIDSFIATHKKMATHSAKFTFPKIVKQINRPNIPKANKSSYQSQNKPLSINNTFL